MQFDLDATVAPAEIAAGRLLDEGDDGRGGRSCSGGSSGGDQAPMPGKNSARIDESVHLQPVGRSLTRAASVAQSAQSIRGLGLVRRIRVFVAQERGSRHPWPHCRGPTHARPAPTRITMGCSPSRVHGRWVIGKGMAGSARPCPVADFLIGSVRYAQLDPVTAKVLHELSGTTGAQIGSISLGRQVLSNHGCSGL
jgi:hypothetical protein